MDSPLNNRETVYFEIDKGQSLKAIAEGLHAKGLLDRPIWFCLMAWTENAVEENEIWRIRDSRADHPPAVIESLRLGQGTPLQPHFR